MIRKFFDKITVSVLVLSFTLPFLSLFFSSLFNCVPVSAAVSSACFSPSGGSKWSTFISSDYKTRIIDSLNRLFDRCNLDSNDYYIFIGDVSTWNNLPYINNLCIFPKSSCTEQYKDENGVYYNILVYSQSFRVSETTTGIDNYNSMSFTNNSGFYKQGIFFNSDKGYGFGQIRDYGNGAVQASPSFFSTWVFIDSLNPSYVPDYSDKLVGFPVAFQFNERDFYNWIIDNNKLSELPSYITSAKLLSFLNFYKIFGSSNSSFLNNIASWFGHMNIANQTNENIIILKNAIDKLYQEYINQYKHEFYSNSANQAHHRRNVNTQTTDDNLTLVTDDSNDDIYTTLLREIIRGIVALQSSIVSGLRAVIDTLNNLDFTVNVANNGGAGFDANSIWGTGDITQSENYLALTSAFMDKGVDVSAAENMQINYLDNATQQDFFTVSVVMPDQFVNGSFTEKTVTHTIDSTSKMYNTLLLFRKLIGFAVIAYFAIRIRFELPHLIRGE